MRVIAVVCMAVVLSGCGAVFRSDMKKAFYEHSRISAQIRLGDSQDAVLEKLDGIFYPVYGSKEKARKRTPDRYVKDGDSYEIHYYQSQLFEDGLVTDDEFTPYTFKNGKLIAVGWEFLGGPKTKGMVKHDTNVYVPPPTVIHRNTTVIERRRY